MATWLRRILTGDSMPSPHLSADDWDQLVKFGRTHGLSQVIYHTLKDVSPCTPRAKAPFKNSGITITTMPSATCIFIMNWARC